MNMYNTCVYLNLYLHVYLCIYIYMPSASSIKRLHAMCPVLFTTTIGAESTSFGKLSQSPDAFRDPCGWVAALPSNRGRFCTFSALVLGEGAARENNSNK